MKQHRTKQQASLLPPATIFWIPPPRLLQWAALLHRFWRYPLLTRASAQMALLLLVALVCMVRAKLGLRGMQVFSHDAFMPLDGAWRLWNGQRPHIDFYSFLGVLAYVPTWAGLFLSRRGAEAFGYGQALAGLLLGLWASLLTRRRLPDVPAALFTLAVVLLATAPFALGYSPLSVSPATTYNRYGYAALALILVEAVLPRKPGISPAEFRGGVSTGSLLVLLLFLKATFFGAGLFLAAALSFCRPQHRRRWAGLLAGSASLLLAFCCYFRFQMLPLLADLAMAAGAKRIHLRAYSLESILSDNATLASFSVVSAALLLAHNRRRSARALTIAGAAVCVTGVLLILGNSEPCGAPLALFLVLILIGQLDFDAFGRVQMLQSAVLFWGTLYAVTSFVPSVLGFGVAAYTAAAHEPSLSAPLLASFQPTHADARYRAFVDDGTALLLRNRQAGDTVMSLDFTNPFSFGLALPPAPGGTAALQYQTTFNDRHRPEASRLFGRARVVMVPKTFSDDTLEDSIPRLYGPYLNAHFELSAESAQWRLYRTRLP